MPPYPVEAGTSAASGHTRPQISEELSLKDIWRFIRVRRQWVVLGAILGILGGIFYTSRQPKLYTSTATVELNRDSNSGLGLQDLSGSASSILSSTQFQTELLTHQNVLLNSNTAMSVISDLNLMSQHPYVDIPEGKDHDEFVRERSLPLDDAPLIRDRALAIFRSGLRVDIVKSTTLLTVSYTDTDPARATMISNAVVQAYLRNHTEARYTATSSASAWLTTQLEGLKRKVEDNHKKVASFQQSTGVVATPMPTGKSALAALAGGSVLSSGPDANSTAVQRLLALNEALSKAEVARIEREAVYRLTQTSSPDIVLQAASTSLVNGTEGAQLAIAGRNLQLLESLRTQAASLKVQLATAQIKYGARFPEVQALQTELASIQEQTKQELSRVNDEARSDFELSKANEEALQKQVDAQQHTVFALGNSLTALTFLEQEEGTSRALYQDLYTRLEEANIAAGVKSTDMVIVDPARKPSAYSSPVLRLNVAVGLALGTTFGLLVGLLIHLRDTSLHTPEEFEEVWNAAQLGVIPRFSGSRSARKRKSKDEPASIEPAPAVPGQTSWLLNSPKSKIAEAYRQIRTSLLLANIDTPPQVILFTSALSGDGKSTTAYNLAVAFALQSSKVLLLDADMRRPTLREKTGCLGKLGLSDLLLNNEVTLADATQPHPGLPTLSVITAGTVPPMPAELIGSQRFRSLVERLRGEYDYILIDGPPALLVTDPILIASSADGIAVVVRADVTTRHVIKLLSAALAKPNIRILGYIINGFDFNSPSYSYGYGYGYGYGYQSKGGYYEEISKDNG